jgi:hypothetical protein
MGPLLDALRDAGGSGAGTEHSARLRKLLLADLARSAAELGRRRSGYDEPVLVAFADAGEIMAVLPVPATVRVDPDSAGERAWLLAAAVVDALHDAAFTLGNSPSAAKVRAGALDDFLVLGMADQAGGDAELGVLAFEEAVERVDRLRAAAVELPGHVLAGIEPLRPPAGASHPLRVAEAVARLGGRPADPQSVAEHEDRVLELLGDRRRTARPHDDPDPVRRVARRILQRLDGMGKWGGYHTEFAHLARGFAGHERALADAVGEALLSEGLLAEKPSTGARHVFLNPRRAGEIHRFIEEGRAPKGLTLPPARAR